MFNILVYRCLLYNFSNFCQCTASPFMKEKVNYRKSLLREYLLYMNRIINLYKYRCHFLDWNIIFEMYIIVLVSTVCTVQYSPKWAYCTYCTFCMSVIVRTMYELERQLSAAYQCTRNQHSCDSAACAFLLAFNFPTCSTQRGIDTATNKPDASDDHNRAAAFDEYKEHADFHD